MVHDEEFEEDQELEEAPPQRGRSGTVGFIAGLVLGALVGAGVALLVAPERGAVTRRRLKKMVRNLKDDASERIAGFRDDLRRRRAEAAEKEPG